ncbi:CHAT domain-containing protein [Maribacter algarum]|uniref:CHAT domain-containing protein n=1 Tax=Maribacter algarum (ex Zhang et al. 2020) TaxID=2578118 RepID=A0A5S3PV12_9FLAO|nr:CHAT domain-containing protein [Maribacter algarum]TMM58032.1 CHAT domain-containing protein [Maribacter algarum]
MKTKKIEYLRFDKLETGILSEGKPYIISIGDKSVLDEVKTPEGHKNLSKKLSDTLRYGSGITQSKKLSVIKEISDSISPFFIDSNSVEKDIDHLEIFLNPSELALIPFELLLDVNNSPRFISKPGGGRILTRNDRRATDLNHNIPETPRVLFAYVTPSYSKTGIRFKEVPHKNHLGSFNYALNNRGGSKQLTVLENPTFLEFKNKILEEGENNKPYTHIHLLAHGLLRIDRNNPGDFEYGIAFNTEIDDPENYKSTSAVEIKSIFEDLSPKNLPYLVNYMICDGANFTNGVLPDKNPLQVTFNVGVPIVIGSQFPLSMDGSNMISKILYNRLFRGDDIREILMEIRTNLYNNKPHQDSHDWISLVTYVNLPITYQYELLNHKTKCQLSILNSIRDGKNKGVLSEDDFIKVKFQINESIRDLGLEANKIEEEKSQEKEFLEYAGLMGSSYKRLAEVEFMEGNFQSSDTWDKQLEYLREAKKWYKKAADCNRSHHWSIVQYLSLKTILLGALDEDDMDYWYAARGAAREEINKAKTSVTWPYGTLIELYLLARPTSNEKGEKDILDFAHKLMTNAKKQGKNEHINSTIVQIERYLKWWAGPNFKIPKVCLADKSPFLNELINALSS